jgi:hypothetical protein
LRTTWELHAGAAIAPGPVRLDEKKGVAPAAAGDAPPHYMYHHFALAVGGGGGGPPGGPPAGVDASTRIRHLTALMAHLKLVDSSQQSIVVSKDVVFCLDYSGSMAGGRIERSVENMLIIFDKFITGDDHVAFLRFNERVEMVCMH